MKKGFTLVELSIVLVIIGLLIGGILVGQSLIGSVKTQRFVSEFQQYQVMNEQFKSRYKSLPGDTSLFPVLGRGAAVANDGEILGDDNSNSFFTSEKAHYWKHLHEAGMLNKEYSVDATSGIRAGVHTPELVYKNAAMTILNPIAPGNKHYYYLISDMSVNTDGSLVSSGYTDILTPAQALAIDIKLDDSIAISDSSGGGTTDVVIGADSSGSGGNCWAASATFPKQYNVNSNEIACTVFLQVQ